MKEQARPTACSEDTKVFDSMQEPMSILDGIERGERAILEKHTLTHVQVKQKMKRWLD